MRPCERYDRYQRNGPRARSAVATLPVGVVLFPWALAMRWARITSARAVSPAARLPGGRARGRRTAPHAVQSAAASSAATSTTWRPSRSPRPPGASTRSRGALPKIAPSLPHPPYCGVSLDRDPHRTCPGDAGLGHVRDCAARCTGSWGISPDLGAGRLAVVHRAPSYEPRTTAGDVLLDAGPADLSAAAAARRNETAAGLRGPATDLTIGATLPDSRHVVAVTLGGRPVPHTVSATRRGREMLVDAGRVHGARRLVVTVHQPGTRPGSPADRRVGRGHATRA